MHIRVIMGANIAGIYGAQIFRSEDRPLYKRGFAINLAIVSTAVVLAGIRYVDDIIRRRKVAGQVQLEQGSGSDEATEKGLKENAGFVDEKQPIAVPVAV
jgi:hypothetical protein